MSKRPHTWMPFYVGDYLRDTSRLTAEGHGVYLLLIFDYWVAGKPLPDDDSQLAAVARLSLGRWKSLRPIITQFFQIADGYWHHKRIDAELEKAVNRYQERSKAGSEGAAKRWQSHSKANDKTIAEPSGSQWQTDAQPQPDKKDSDASASGAGAPLIDPVKEIFRRGLVILGGDTPAHRKLLGKLRQSYGDVVVLAAIIECENEMPSDPAGYLVACCERRKQNGRGSGHAAALDVLARAAIDHDERQGHRGHFETPH